MSAVGRHDHGMVGVLLIGLILGALFFYVGSARPVMTAFSDEMTASQQTYSELETEKEELEGELQTQEQKLSAYQVMATGEVEHAITAFEQLPDKTTADNNRLLTSGLIYQRQRNSLLTTLFS